MTDTWQAGYRNAVANFITNRGHFVDIGYYPRDDWGSDEPDPDDYDEHGITYGWADYDHTRGYPWRDEPGCPVETIEIDTMRERGLLQFQDTFTGSKQEVGIEFRASCACGKYVNKWFRWQGSASDILPELLRE